MATTEAAATEAAGPDGVAVAELSLGSTPTFMAVDHLDGIVFVDRMRDMSSLGFEKDINSAEEDES